MCFGCFLLHYFCQTFEILRIWGKFMFKLDILALKEEESLNGFDEMMGIKNSTVSKAAPPAKKPKDDNAPKNDTERAEPIKNEAPESEDIRECEIKVKTGGRDNHSLTEEEKKASEDKARAAREALKKKLGIISTESNGCSISGRENLEKEFIEVKDGGSKGKDGLNLYEDNGDEMNIKSTGKLEEIDKWSSSATDIDSN